MTTTTRGARRGAQSATTPPALIKITLGVVVAIMIAVGVCSQAGSGTATGASPAAALPDGFPLPAGATLARAEAADPGGVVTMTAPGNVEDIAAFYGTELPKSGWSVEEWSGTDPFGDASQGYIITKDKEAGALSVKDAGDGRVEIQVNMNQPVTPSEGGGHGGMGGGMEGMDG